MCWNIKINKDRVFILRWTIPWSTSSKLLFFFYSSPNIFFKDWMRQQVFHLHIHFLSFWSCQSFFPISMRQFGCPNRSATLISPQSPVSVRSQCHRSLEERLSPLSQRPRRKCTLFFTVRYSSHYRIDNVSVISDIYLFTHPFSLGFCCGVSIKWFLDWNVHFCCSICEVRFGMDVCCPR